MFRVKFTLTKLQEDVSENGAETNCSASENYINKENKNKELFILQTHVGQANRKPKAKPSCRLTAHFKKFRKTSTFSLKDERVLLLSHTLQAA